MAKRRKADLYKNTYLDNLLGYQNRKYKPSYYFSPSTVDKIARYSKQILQSLLIIFIVFTVTFFLLQIIGGSPEILNDPKLNEVSRNQLMSDMHLDESSISQYGYALLDIFNGTMGTSWEDGAQVSTKIFSKMGISIQIGLIAFSFSLLIGIPMGVVFGSTDGSAVDWTSAIFSSIAFAVPTFVIALIVVSINYALGLPIVFDYGNAFMYLIPALVLAIPISFTYVRYLKTSINQEWRKQYVKFAKVKGVKKNRILYRHTFKSALFPIATYLPFVAISVFFGSLTVETIFAIPGSGKLLVDSVLSGDNPTILGLVFVYTIVTVLAFLIRDILYDMLDPRIRVK
ncbi:MAG: ABC transporter permease [Mycoplasmataceae bacterium]|nr:ABC transporter permease [Mycoplasmataceae bacterium]